MFFDYLGELGLIISGNGLTGMELRIANVFLIVGVLFWADGALSASESCVFSTSWNFFNDKTETCVLNSGGSDTYSVTGIPRHYCINTEWYVEKENNGQPLDTDAQSTTPSFKRRTVSDTEIVAVIYNCESPWERLETHRWIVRINPGKPKNISVRNITKTSADVSWSKGSGASTTFLEYI